MHSNDLREASIALGAIKGETIQSRIASCVAQRIYGADLATARAAGEGTPYY